MMERQYRIIEDNLQRIRSEIGEAAVSVGRSPDEISLLAVTKTQPPDLVNRVIACGVNLLGENRAQELLEKYEAYDKSGVSIHFIGHLQTNKVKQIVDKVDMIHSVDSPRLAEEIQRQCEKRGREMQVLLEVNIGGERSKSGVEPERLVELIHAVASLPRLRLRGLMTIPPVCDSEAEAERYFARMHQLFIDIKEQNIDNVAMDILSMGMSGDYAAAIKHGATIVRLGTAIFGPRDYTR